MSAPLRFDCLRCGECCRAWTVVVDRAHVEEKLRGIDWIEGLSRERKAQGHGPLLPPGPGAGRCHLDTSVGPTLDCVFLGAGGLCEIHRRTGAEAKPATCRQFPFHFVQTPAGVETSLDPACASVARGHGEEVELIELAAMQADGRIEELPSDLVLRPGEPLAWPEYQRLRDEVRTLLSGDDPIETRLLAAWSHVHGIPAQRPRADPFGRRLALTLLLLVYRNAWDRKAIRASTFADWRRAYRLLRLAMGLLLGGGRVPIEARGIVVSGGEVDALPWTPDGEGTRVVFDRWLTTWVDRHELAPVATRGVGALLLTWMMVSFFTRAVAVARQRSPNAEDAADGVQLAEKFTGARTMRLALKDDALGRSLVSMSEGRAVVRWVLG